MPVAMMITRNDHTIFSYSISLKYVSSVYERKEDFCPVKRRNGQHIKRAEYYAESRGSVQKKQDKAEKKGSQKAGRNKKP